MALNQHGLNFGKVVLNPGDGGDLSGTGALFPAGKGVHAGRRKGWEGEQLPRLRPLLGWAKAGDVVLHSDYRLHRRRSRRREPGEPPCGGGPGADHPRGSDNALLTLMKI